MFLSDRDLKDAITLEHLIVVPPPSEYDTTSIDLHLDKIDTARVWNYLSFEKDQKTAGHDPPALRMGFDSKAFSEKYTQAVTTEKSERVFREGNSIFLKPFGFFLWQTAEIVGTPEENPRFICFIDGKSSKARTGLLVHMTAPTIHAGWWGQVTLEISNLGPFTVELNTGQRFEVDHPGATAWRDGAAVFRAPGGVLIFFDHESVNQIINAPAHSAPGKRRPK